jgi:two-component system, LuxR family, response regulator FixJ
MLVRPEISSGRTKLMKTPTAVLRPAIVVIVDDDAALLGSLKFSLELEGFAIRAYPDAEAVLASAEAGKAACIVVDYKLPGMNGLELLHEMRTRGIAAPAILITTAPGAALRDRAARDGVILVEKPLFGNALSESIRNLCKGNHAPR